MLFWIQLLSPYKELLNWKQEQLFPNKSIKDSNKCLEQGSSPLNTGNDVLKCKQSASVNCDQLIFTAVNKTCSRQASTQMSKMLVVNSIQSAHWDLKAFFFLIKVSLNDFLFYCGSADKNMDSSSGEMDKNGEEVTGLWLFEFLIWIHSHVFFLRIYWWEILMQ